MNPQPKPKAFRSQAYLNWLKDQPVPSRIFGTGDTVYHHVKMFGNGGMALKPPDNDALPIPDSVHKRLDDIGNSERSVLLEETGYSVEELRALCDGYFEMWSKQAD
jgi:hypothetical protein